MPCPMGIKKDKLSNQDGRGKMADAGLVGRGYGGSRRFTALVLEFLDVSLPTCWEK